MLIVGKIALRPEVENPNLVRLYFISLSAHKHFQYSMHDTSVEKIDIPGDLMIQKNLYETISLSVCVWWYADVLKLCVHVFWYVSMKVPAFLWLGSILEYNSILRLLLVTHLNQLELMLKNAPHIRQAELS